MRIAPEGVPYIALGILLVLVFWGLSHLVQGSPGLARALTTGAVLMVVLTLFVAFFFRDPSRRYQAAPGEVLAPADGRIVQITEVQEGAFIQGPAVRISIFLTIFNVHVQKAPITGTVELKEYNPGKFLAAWDHKASEENEQATLGIASGPHRVMVRQIAGLVARRVVTDPVEGQSVTQGQRIGIIQFGSRVDLFVPAGWEIIGEVGEKAVAGRSVLARIPREEGGSAP